MFIQGGKRNRSLELHNVPKSAPRSEFEFQIQIPNGSMDGFLWMGFCG